MLVDVLADNPGGKDPEISVADGEVTIKNFKKCMITNNGEIHTIDNGRLEQYVKIDHPMFGLISWTCDESYKGETISFFTCGSCGLYCVYNQYITRCENKNLPVVVGLLSAFIIFSLVVIMTLTLFKKKVNMLCAKIIVYFLMRSDRRRVRRIIKYNKATGLNIDVKLKKIMYNNDIIDDLIKSSRIMLIKRMTSLTDEPIYSDIIYNRSADYRVANELLKRSEKRIELLEELKTNSKYMSRRPSRIGRDVVTGLVMATALPTDTYCCSQMLYIKSNGRICYSGKCYDLSTYSLSLADGETACFNDLENERLSIKLDSIHNIARFSSLYDTSDYEITNKMTWNCLGSGKCWYGNECGNGYALNSLEENTTEPHGYGCHMTGVSCVGSMCTHGTSCVWYRWQINPKGPKIPVYNLVSEIWEVELSVRYKNVVKTIKLNTNNPKYDMNNILSDVMDHMPFYISGVSYEKKQLKNSILSINDTYFNLDSSPHNMPQRGIIGDLQIDKHGEKMLYYDNTMDCSVDSCTVKCVTNEPAINRLLPTSPYRIDKEYISHLKMYNSGWINYKYRSSGHGTISFGNVELKELIVEKPHCNIKVGLSYACEACNEQPRATMVSTNVKTEGMMEYESNCTWDRPSLSCNNEMYDIIQISKNKYCNIYIPTINQTIDIQFDYEYRGILSDMKTIRAETSMDILTDIVSNANFITTLVTSLSSFLLFTGIATMLIKLTRLGILAIGRREVSNA